MQNCINPFYLRLSYPITWNFPGQNLFQSFQNKRMVPGRLLLF